MWKPPAELRERWIANDFQLEHVAMDALRRGSLDGVGLGLHDGRIDMRAFDTPPAREARAGGSRRGGGLLNLFRPGGATGWITLENARLESVDFTHARLPGLTFRGVTFIDCLFDRGDLDNAKFGACRFDNCSFMRAELSVTSLGDIGSPGGRPLPSRFEECRFANATLGFTFSWGSEFVRCDFTRTRFRDTHWYGCHFVDCAFAGEIRESEFRATDPHSRTRPRPAMLDGVDLSRTALVECEFYGLDFNATVFPQDANHLVVDDFPCFLRALAAALVAPKTKAGEYSARWAKRQQDRLGPNQKRGVVNLNDHIDPWPADCQAELVSAYDEALSECGQSPTVASRTAQLKPSN